MRIGFYIGALLYQHDCVVIPGFGGFIANYAPACIHPVQNTFIPPSRQIMFNAGLIHNDGLLASHVATEEGISYDQALNRISEEVMAYHAELKAGKTVHMDGLGSFRTNHEDSLVFTPDTRINWLEEAFGLPTFVSPAIRRSGYRSKRDSDDKVRSIYLPVAVRRIAAIAIPVLAIGMWSLFNTSRINSFASNYSSIVPSDLISHLSFSSLKKSVPVYVLSHSRIDV
ncbi:MAG: hypothetical protein Q8908_16700, partial [Bacteroidota bacterium]|nr:hypothetical protein [Bacteroidota bacterium]